MSSSSISFISPHADVHFVDVETLKQEKEKFASVLPVSKDARTVFDLSAEEILETEERMMPGGWSDAGFLKLGDRLLSVCIADGKTLLKNEVPCDLIADIIDSILEESLKSRDPELLIAGKFKVIRGASTVSYQECPFAESKETACHKGRADLVITNMVNQTSILANDLTIEMIRNHFFFQTGPYALRPQDAIDCLDLKTTSYKIITEKFAQHEDFENLNIPNDLGKYEKEKEKAAKYAVSFSIDCGVTGFILPYNEIYVDQETKEEAEEFLHVFNDKKREEDQLIWEIFGYKLSDPIKWEGIYVYKLKTKTRVDLFSSLPNPGVKRNRCSLQ